MKARLKTIGWGIGLILILAGCSGLGQTPPPTPLDVDSLGTAIVLTENAPPAGLETVSYEVVDRGLDDLQGYRYTLEVRFEGMVDSDLTATTGTIQAEVWWDGIAPARRVRLAAAGAAFASDPRQLEAVRITDSYYLVDQNGRCSASLQEAARGVADLDAGTLIGGVAEAAYSSTRATLNGVDAYRYTVTPANAILPPVGLLEGGGLELDGELWVNPQSGVVVRYYANVTLSHVTLFESEIPVSGELFIRYDVFDLDVVPNISIPFGC